MRNSSFEVLRLLAVMLIIAMHILGYVDHALLSPANKAVLAGVNIIGNTGVSCFVLISGYFGVKFKFHKFIYLIVISSLYTLFVTCLNDGYDLKEAVKALLVIPRYKLWFIVCYLFLMLLSPYLNQFAEMLEKKEFTRLLALLTVLLCVVPTVFFEAANSDVILHQGGKNLTYFLFLYLIGRYIRKYFDKDYSRTLSASVFFLSSGIMAVIAALTGILLVSDCSIFILLSSLSLFFFFKSFCFHSRTVNYITSSVLAIYVLNWIYIFLDKGFIHIEEHASSISFVLYLAAEVLIVVLAALIIDKTLGALVNRLLTCVEERFPVLKKKTT